MAKNKVDKKSKNRIIKKKLKKKGFPIGIFLILFIFESLVVSGATLFYFVYVSKKEITIIEEFTKNDSITIAEASAGFAEIGLKTKSYKKLRLFFRKNIKGNLIDEAFFVLKNGSIIVHSDKEIEKELNGNIANDEFSYNTDLILKPVRTRSRDVLFTDYNIITKRVPFNRLERKLLKEYLYEKIDTVGWLVSKAVFEKRRPIGTVNFIIGKDRIYENIQKRYELSKMVLMYALGGAFAISFLISLIVFIRYRSIQKKTLLFSEESYEMSKKQAVLSTIANEDHNLSEPEQLIEVNLEDEKSTLEEESISIELMDEFDKENDDINTSESLFENSSITGKDETSTDIQPFVYSDESIVDTSKEIKDAIPIVKRRS